MSEPDFSKLSCPVQPMPDGSHDALEGQVYPYGHNIQSVRHLRKATPLILKVPIFQWYTITT